MRRTTEALSVALVLALAAGCGGERDVDGEPVEAVAAPPTADEVGPEPGAPEPTTGPDGALLPSDQSFAGLVLPRGLEVVVSGERRRVYRSRASIDSMLAYLGPRLGTAIVERDTRGAATYRGATPEGEHAETMDVTVAPTSGRAGTRVEIQLAPREALGMPGEDDVRRRLEALAASAE